MTTPFEADERAVRGSNHTGMRQFNERIVLQAIRLHGAIPKADLARLTQLSSQTVSVIVSRLLDDGLLIKQDRIRGKIGQPSVPLSLDPDGAISLGVQVGRRSLEVLACDFVGKVRFRHEFHYAYPDPAQVLPCIQQGLDALQTQLGPLWSRVVGLGLTSPLSMDKWASLLGSQAHNALAGWQHMDLKQEVEAMTRLPVSFAKDTTAACVAELLQGHGQNVRSFLYVFVGTFVGGGLVLAGHIDIGHRGNAGAIGSLPVGLAAGNGSAPPQLLEVASGWQLEQALLKAGLDPLLVQQDTIMDHAYAVYTEPWLEQAGLALAMTVASGAAMLDLDAVIIDGSLARPLIDALLQRTRERLAAYKFDGMHQPALLAGRVGAHARALGGSLLPLHTQFFPDKDIFLKPSMG
ncbi:ROK family transcriptional regulator [uncultured Sphaerotilus sp.]|uniref:ROK family transcriptional regulator n=1 Tax=uncultured Sphaerotilus sp. TaxID=474984 RepID=UPI0030CA3B7A